jgi:hypothetical protein
MDIRECEICHQQFVAGYGYSISVAWNVTGHAYVAGFMCEKRTGGQHWGCTAEHALLAVQKCLIEHMHTGILLEKHLATGMPRYSEQDAEWAQKGGDDFHIVSVTRKGE